MNKKLVIMLSLLGLLISLRTVNASDLNGDQILNKMEEVRDIKSCKLELKMELYY